MSKRLRRLFPPFEPVSLTPLVAQDVNVVLRDDRTLFGKLELLDSDSLLVRDGRDHPHRVRLTDVAGILYDQQSEIFPKLGEPS